MLGKTHLVSSLAVAEAGLLLYYGYTTQTLSVSSELPEDIVSFLTPALFATFCAAVVMVSLLLLSIGSDRFRLGCAGALLLIMAFFYMREPTMLSLLFLLSLFMLGSLSPDIDSESSSIGRYVAPVARLIPHRTITHTVWAVLLLCGAAWYVDSLYLWAFALGYSLHIVEDSFSRQGICWFYPFFSNYKTYSSGAVVKSGRSTRFTYRTGGMFESVVFYASVACSAAFATMVFLMF